MVIRKTVMERRAEIPRVTFSPESHGTKKTRRAVPGESQSESMNLQRCTYKKTLKL